jgi:hypothetical protein
MKVATAHVGKVIPSSKTKSSTLIRQIFVFKSFIITALMTSTTLYGQSFDEYRWKNRVLVIEAAAHSSINLIKQIQELSTSQKELKERKLIIFQKVNGEYKKVDFGEYDFTKIPKSPNSEDSQQADFPNTFKITLIGLDGGIKLEKPQVLKMADLFAVIDAMPMRKSEIRNSHP